ncbi:hypothetical protein ACGFWD_43880 [Streptomyces sp. NPDC048448]|nr:MULTISPECIES: hypothetical protein [unclassified Streptomyces]
MEDQSQQDPASPEVRARILGSFDPAARLLPRRRHQRDVNNPAR